MEQRKFKNIIIFGCGGVGSWVANFVVRNKLSYVISLVDFDFVEEKNIKRQNYSNSDITHTKVFALRESLKTLNLDEDDNVEVLMYNRKIIEEIDLTFNKNDIAIICTDNIGSKRLIAKHFFKYIIVNCDKDFVELKNYLDEEDLKSWDMGGGYSNAQDIVSNIYASILTYFCLNNWGLDFWKRKRRIIENVEKSWINLLKGV